MPVTRVRDLLRPFDDHVREPGDPGLDGDWCLTISRSRNDGRLYLQLESRRSPSVLSAIDGADISDLDGLLSRLSAAASRGRTRYRS